MERRILAAAALVLSSVVMLACSGADASYRTGAGSEADSSTSAKPEREHVLAVGTTIQLRTADTVTSRRNRVGERVVATVSAPVREGGAVVIPSGAQFLGTITAIAPAENPRQRGTLSVRFTAVRFGGNTHPIAVRVDSLPTQLRGRGVTTGDAAKVGAGAVVGGIAGRVIGGDRTGTLVGAATGAAAGAVYASETRDLDVVLPAGAPIRVVLTEPFRPRAPRPVT